MSPDFLTKILEEYCELPVLWQVRSSDYSKRTRRVEAWDLLVQFTRERIPDADTPHSSSIITAAATRFHELILDTEMHEQSPESVHACVVKHIRARLPSQARRARLVRVWAPLRDVKLDTQQAATHEEY
jgi:hypothetical protein